MNILMELVKRPQKALKLFSPTAWSRLMRSKKSLDKNEKRKRRFFLEWNHEAKISRRKYSTYADYTQHQAAKLKKVESGLYNQFEDRVALFKSHFKKLTCVAHDAEILCLGARLGHEVKALRDLGYSAVGVDLNPGFNNPYVVVGDFNHLDFADNSFDTVYTNSLDHAFEIETVMSEVHRVLRSRCVFIADIAPGYEEGFAAGSFESMHWPTASGFAELLGSIRGFKLLNHSPLRESELPEGAVRAILQAQPTIES